MKALRTLAVIVTGLLVPALAHAFTLTTWQQDGTPVSSAPGEQIAPTCVSDGTGGAFVVWDDDNNQGSGSYDIRIRRVTAYGMMLWGDGVVVCGAVNNQLDPALAADGAGGVIVVWRDNRSGAYDLYAQRINASGVVQWTPDGVPVSVAPGSVNALHHIVSDGAGGAIISWADYTGSGDIYAQRIDASGAALWGANGIPICNTPDYQDTPTLVSDGAGGAFVVWTDLRSGTADIYGQRVNTLGVAQWALNGIPLSPSAGQQASPDIVSDGAGGAIVTWLDQVGWDIWAQKVDASGALLWAANGVAVCRAANNQYNQRIVSDNLAGAIIAWEDFRNGTDTDIYAQRISSAGAPQWAGDGVVLCSAWNDQWTPRIAADGVGGALVAWQDYRNDSGDIYAQRINGAGKVVWNPDGEAVCNAANGQNFPVVAADGSAGAIVVWHDGRTFAGDIYAQRVDLRYGYWGYPEPTIVTVKDVPADQGGKVRVSWAASGRDSLNDQIISHYSIWRATDAAAVASMVLANASLVSLLDVGEAFAGPAIREEQTAAGTLYWELVGTQEAIYRNAYAFTASTGYDSSAAGPATQQFQVVAHAYGSQYLNWPSNIVSGYSVDNLAPPAPLYLTAQRVGNDVNLKWNRVHAPDLRNYSVYRATSVGVTPVPTNFLADSNDSLLVDTGAPLVTLHYIVTAKDVHANQSAPSNEAVVSGATGVGNTPAITQLTVLQNFPNPFATQTDLQIGLPAPSDVRVEIYDVAGRRVGSRVVRDAAAGWQKISFAGRDDRGAALASGVYFYRITANGATVTRKMVIAR